MKRTIGFLVFLLLLGFGFVFGWRWAADEMTAKSAQIEANIAKKGGNLNCAGRRVEGFPFRLGIHCTSIAFSPPRGGTYSAGAFRSAAQLYNPGFLVAEIDGPADLQLPDGQRFQLGWENLRASGRANLSGLSRVSVEIGQPVLSEGFGSAGAQTLAKADDFQLHARMSPQKTDAVDVALSVVAMRDDAARFPALGFSADFEIESFQAQLRPGALPIEHIREYGAKGELRSLLLEPKDGGRLELSGPLSVDKDGIVDGDITVAASELRLLAAFFIQLLPQESETISNIASLLDAIKPDNPQADAKSRNIKLSIRRSRLSIGFLPLGELPPLW